MNITTVLTIDKNRGIILRTFTNERKARRIFKPSVWLINTSRFCMGRTDDIDIFLIVTELE